MRSVLKTLVATILATAIAAGSAGAAVRIKDIAKVEGVRDNQLFGYGIVVGLAGSGDGIRMTQQTVANMLERLGLVVDINDVNSKNVAAVMVTASLPAFNKEGDTIDVVVSSVGDAKSLQGGTLLITPLKGADGQVYAVAQGSISIGGWSSGTGGAQKTKGHATVGRIVGGATVERSVDTEFVVGNRITLSMNNPDFTTAANIADGINFRFGKSTAKAVDASTIVVSPSDKELGNIVPFLAELENIQIDQDQVSKVVINEKTGTIVMGGDVSIDLVSIAHGTLTVTVKPQNQAVLPMPFTEGKPMVIQNPEVTADEKEVSFHTTTTGDVVRALNDMGVTASDIIAILQALKVSGALQAEIVIM